MKSFLIAVTAALFLAGCAADGSIDEVQAEKARKLACTSALAGLLVAETEGDEKAIVYLKGYLTARCPDFYAPGAE